MTNRERVRAVLNFQKPDDRLPAIEWASWWDLTIKAWREQGLPNNIEWSDICLHLGMDPHHQFWFAHQTPDSPKPAYHGAPIMYDEADYEKLKPYLFPAYLPEQLAKQLLQYKEGHDRGDYAIWFSMDGGFWFQRCLFGIENHFYSFYDYPELYHRILDDMAEYQLNVMEKIYEVLTPDFMTIAEDMSYNKGPMLSEECFEEFIAPYYRKVIPFIHAHGTKVIVDTDGDVSEMIPWLKRAGVDGVLPLERQAGVDLNALRKLYPDFIFIGGFDKMSMRQSTEAMRAEFERLLPVMKSGGYIPSVDHQTPPDVPLERYYDYVALLKEYGERAVKED